MLAYRPHKKFTPPVVLDCEASGLVRESYPIEVGFVYPSGEVVSYLIQPEPTWTHWDPFSEEVHNIPREQLFEEGLPAIEVAQKLNSVLRDTVVYSDAPNMERMWLARLFNDTNTLMLFEVEHLHCQFVQHQHQYFHEYKRKLKETVTAHRAGNDAWVLQQATLRSRQKAVDLHYNNKK